MLGKIDFYGDKTRWFVAKVVDNLDPELRGRVKISIKGIHSTKQSDIAIAQLPWAQTLLPTTEGGTSGIGKHAQLLPNALVFGVFLDGEKSQLPLVLGSLNQIEKPSQAQNYFDNPVIPVPLTQNNNSTSDRNNTDDEGRQAIPNTPGSGPDGIVLSGTVVQSGDREGTRESRRWASVSFFVENGFSVIQAAGITGNLEQESGFKPTIVSSFAGESSQGIAQWNPDAGRLQQLKNFASYSNRDWRAFTTQLLFIMHEFKGRPLGANDGASDFSTCYQMIRNSTRYNGGQPPTGQERYTNNATYAFHRWHSGGGRPSREWIATSLSRREQYAAEAYNQYTSSVSSAV
jgi:hypothetical protein